MKNLVVILSFVLSGICAFGQVSAQESLIAQANQSYAESNFETAVQLYDSVLTLGYESAGLYFNLGNAYFKLKDIPSAILYYEKAKKLDPNDEDIRFNLELANSRIIDKMEPLPEFFLRSWLRAVRDMLSSDQWAKIGVG